MNITERLADWLCAQRWQDIPETARRKAVDVVYDSVGAMIACSQQGVFGLMEKHAVAPGDIAAVEVQIPQRGLKRVPTTRHASISALTVCAIAAAHGKLDFYRLHDPAGAMDDAARDMQQRVTFVGREDWTDLQAGHRAVVTIRTRGGQVLTEEVRHRPMTGDELDRKFDGLVEPRFGKENMGFAK